MFFSLGGDDDDCECGADSHAPVRCKVCNRSVRKFIFAQATFAPELDSESPYYRFEDKTPCFFTNSMSLLSPARRDILIACDKECAEQYIVSTRLQRVPLTTSVYKRTTKQLSCYATGCKFTCNTFEEMHTHLTKSLSCGAAPAVLKLHVDAIEARDNKKMKLFETLGDEGYPVTDKSSGAGGGKKNKKNKNKKNEGGEIRVKSLLEWFTHCTSSTSAPDDKERVRKVIRVLLAFCSPELDDREQDIVIMATAAYITQHPKLEEVVDEGSMMIVHLEGYVFNDTEHPPTAEGVESETEGKGEDGKMNDEEKNKTIKEGEEEYDYKKMNAEDSWDKRQRDPEGTDVWFRRKRKYPEAGIVAEPKEGGKMAAIVENGKVVGVLKEAGRIRKRKRGESAGKEGKDSDDDDEEEDEDGMDNDDDDDDDEDDEMYFDDDDDDDDEEDGMELGEGGMEDMLEQMMMMGMDPSMFGMDDDDDDADIMERVQARGRAMRGGSGQSGGHRGGQRGGSGNRGGQRGGHRGGQRGGGGQGGQGGQGGRGGQGGQGQAKSGAGKRQGQGQGQGQQQQGQQQGQQANRGGARGGQSGGGFSRGGSNRGRGR